MFGGSRIGPWRQCNAVSPSVTATQTGPGTHNGMALTVKVVNGAQIVDVGAAYRLRSAVGVTASQAPPVPPR